MCIKKIRYLWLTAICTFVALVVLGSASSASVLRNLWSDCPTYQGENGFYAEAYDPAASSFRFLDDMIDSASNHFYGTPNQPWGWAKLQKLASRVLMCPTVSPRTEWVVYTYQTSVAGTYSTTGTFTSTKAATDVNLLVFLNDDVQNPLWSASIAGTTGLAKFDLAGFDLGAGDKLRFAVDAGLADPDSAYLTGTIGCIAAAVPEPGSLAVVVMGLAGFIATRRRR